MYRIGFRVDASLQIGSGHVMRTLTLADSLRARGAKCSFFCRPHQGHMIEFILQRGHHAHPLPLLEKGCSFNLDGAMDAKDTQHAIISNFGSRPIDLLIVDHYDLDASWENALRPQARRIMVIDDLADRNHSCDLLLDQNLGRKVEDYLALLEGMPIRLIGPKYALLRHEFALLRPQSLLRRKTDLSLRRLLIAMGGVDKDDATGQVLAALKSCKLPDDLVITVVMGSSAPWLEKVRNNAAQMPWRTEVLVGVSNMAKVMAISDLAIGASGVTALERCSLGLPSIVLVLAQNQFAGAVALKDLGAITLLDTFQQITNLMGSTKSSAFVNEILSKQSDAAASVTDGQGCSMVVDEIMEIIHV